MTVPAVSIVMRSYNEAWALKGTLAALKIQTFRNWELIVIDSGSTDGSVELIRAANPRHLVQIQPHEYHPPRVMNLGMRLASANWVIFLNADCTPTNAHWLAPLVRSLRDPDVAAVYGRQVPRPDCAAVFAADYDRCFGPRRASAKWDHFFSMASSGVRKDIWELRGFNEAMQYSEDDEYTRWARARGYQVLYVPESVAMHSHNYTPAQAWKRTFGEGRALAAVWEGNPGEFNFPRTVLLGLVNDARKDLWFCLRRGRLREWPHALRIRWEQRRARLAGFRAGWEHYRASALAIHPPVWARWEIPRVNPPVA
ncbi:MAG: Rhamnosyltransferase [Lacunisphaera sp.]|nr:Rhamnosyltransferase [Lacunisphaera sp.]